MNRHYMLEALLLSSGRRLPSAYQEVEYIESTGTQYIDTGVNVLPTLTVKIDWLPTAGNDNPIFGGRDETVSQQILILYAIPNYSNAITIRFGPNSTQASFELVPPRRALYELSLNGFFIDKNKVHDAFSIFPTYSSSRGNATLFAFNHITENRIITMGKGAKLYSCKIYDNRTPIRNFVPCYRKADDEIGLYDLVNNVFYTNQGTGTFRAGPIVGPTSSDSIEGNALSLAPANTITGNTLNINNGDTIVGNTLNI